MHYEVDMHAPYMLYMSACFTSNSLHILSTDQNSKHNAYETLSDHLSQIFMVI